MAYTYPKFAKVLRIHQAQGKRYRMEIEIDPTGSGTFVVIQKNPSRANAEVSDHTINRVLNYLYLNREKNACLRGVRRVVFLNLIPWYETYSDRLIEKEKELYDPKNLSVIAAYLSSGDPCIIAWGNPPKGLREAYKSLTGNVLALLSKHSNPLYHVGEFTRLGFPRHGQIWGYTDPMRNIKLM
jgi:hypothetical protein